MLDDYLKAKRIGERQVHRAVAQGQYPYPPALDDLVEAGLSEYPVGLAEVPLEMVAGTRTAGRQNAFSNGFMPILSANSEFAVKWSNLYDAQMTEGIRDPIKAYEYMRRFYVQEGNKRVSVMKYLHMPLIMADVTRVLPKRSDEKDVKIYYEFLDFYNVCPLYEIGFTEEGSYAKLAELLGQDLVHQWREDAVQTLRSAYTYFDQVFQSKSGGKLKITAADAFLVYLTIYRIDDLLNSSRSEIAIQMDRIWNELLVENQQDDKKITLVDRPQAIAGIEQAAPAAASPTGLLSMLRGQTVYSERHPLRIAFIYDKSPEKSAWIYGHELGRNQLEQTYPGVVETIRYDDVVTDASFARVIDAACADENDLIITTSPAQMTQTLKAAIDHPDVKFMNCSINLSHNAVRTYYGRMYEAKFLMGSLAASLADNHRIGYRADYPIYGTIANINAFAIGAALVDPRAKLYLSWDSKKDSNWREAFYRNGVSVFSGPDLIRPEAASREYGIYKYDEGGRIRNLAVPVWNWGRYYELIIRTILNGTWEAKNLARKDQALNYWWGMDAGVIDVIFSEKLSYYSRKLMRTLKGAVIAGTLNPFDGELRSQQGVIKTADAPRLTNEEIITMDWLNDNVIGAIPTMEELRDTARITVSVSGVQAVEAEQKEQTVPGGERAGSESETR
ncbi:BMP family ABC transporter substrate-binding protein [Chordicoccus furentiruminis]|uniref:BMP family ABC transporter substrate-binding protein n=1 Tax=Chordicoccus furentiruminis TaxID=2709410 RepID=UPI0023A7E36A|nr:BMP family ABC transporter substrate-binding protein [Chordicoccus furentiruminis]